MLEHVIEYNGKNYPVKEPTIKTWTEVMKLKDILDDGELFIKVIELTTGLSQEEILAADASQVKKVGEKVLSIVTGSNKKVVTTFTHNGEDYEFLDVSNLTFGQFIDIDTFLGKDENYRTQNLAQLAAYLFIEKGSKYGDNNVAQRTKKFEELPIKYMEGAVFFLLNIANLSAELTQIYSKSKTLKWVMKTKILFRLIGVGTRQLAHLLKTKYGYSVMLLAYPWLKLSIILRTLWILIRNKKKK
jgi:hypothetical protein